MSGEAAAKIAAFFSMVSFCLITFHLSYEYMHPKVPILAVAPVVLSPVEGTFILQQIAPASAPIP